MEEDLEIDLLLKSNEHILHEAAGSIGDETSSENEEIGETSIRFAKITENGLEILENSSNAKTQIAKQTKKNNGSRTSCNKKEGNGVSVEGNQGIPLDELQQQLDNHMISLIAKEPQKHVFPQNSRFSDDESLDSEDDNTRNVDSTHFINEFTADDELPYRGTFVEEIRRQFGNKSKKLNQGGIFKELNNAQRLLLKRDELLSKLEVKLQEEISINQERQKQVHDKLSLLSSSDSSKIKNPSYSRNFFKKFGMPYFEDSDGFACPPNEDSVSKKNGHGLNVLSVPRLCYWTKKDKDTLIECVKATLLDENTERLKKEIFKLKDKLVEKENENKMLSEINDLQNELRGLQSQSYSSLISKEHPDREYDWMKYSAMHFDETHSPDECRRFWHIYLKPTINRSKWTAQEDVKLIEVAEQMHHQDWDGIAQLLGTNRSAYQCFLHYQTRLHCKNRYTSGKWTKDEDDKLTSIINFSKIGDFIPWSKVSAHFPNRSHTQVYSRWNNCLNPKLVKGKFTKEEDLLIVSGIEVFGASYKELSSLIENRSSAQVRERYERHLLPKTSKIGIWSFEEDEKLLRLVKKHGVQNWSAIASEIRTRSRTQVRQRYNTIQHMMKTKPDWTIANAKRRPNKDLAKDLKRTWKKVEKLRNEISIVEKAFDLTVLERETFRIEKLKELRDTIMMKKYESKRKKRVFSDSCEVNALLIEYFKSAHPRTIARPRLKPGKQNDSQASLNEMLTIARYLGHELELPKSKEEIMSNPRLEKRLKLILKDTLCKTEETDAGLLEEASASGTPAVEQIVENIDYAPPDTDESTEMNSWWFLPPFDVSRLNFAEFFKRTVFDYSSGMHKDIWLAMVNRSISNPEPVIPDQTVSSSSDQPFFIPPNFLTTVGLRTLILSKTRLKRDASAKGFSRFLHKSTSLKKSKESDESVSNTIHLSDRADFNKDNRQLNKMINLYQTTLMTLFSWPKALSLTDIAATPFNKQRGFYINKVVGDQAKVAASKVRSLLDTSSGPKEDDISEIRDPYVQPNCYEENDEMKKVFKRNIEARRRALAHIKGNKCSRKMKIEHLLKQEPKKETAPKLKRIRKSKKGLCLDQSIIYKRLKNKQGKQDASMYVKDSESGINNLNPVREGEAENGGKLSVKLPSLTYKRSKRLNLESCSSTWEYIVDCQENEICIEKVREVFEIPATPISERFTTTPASERLTRPVNKRATPDPSLLNIEEKRMKFEIKEEGSVS